MFLADYMWVVSMPGTVDVAVVCASERFLIVSDTHSSFPCMRNAAEIFVVGALDVSVTLAYTELSIHLVPAPSTTPTGSASAVVYMSSMQMTSVMLTCIHCTPLGERLHVHSLAIAYGFHHHVPDGGMCHGVVVVSHKGTVGLPPVGSTPSLVHSVVHCRGTHYCAASEPRLSPRALYAATDDGGHSSQLRTPRV